jgi:hypothetical protein
MKLEMARRRTPWSGRPCLGEEPGGRNSCHPVPLASVPVLVGIHLLAHLQAEGLHLLQGLGRPV